MTIFSQRRKKIISLARGRNVVAATPENLFYISDFYGGGVGVVKPERTVIVTTSLEEERANSTGKEVEVIRAPSSGAIWKTVGENLETGSCFVDDDREVRDSRRYVKNEDIFHQARRVKDAEEISRITGASSILDKIFGILESQLGAGKTEREVAAEVVRSAILSGATTSGFRGSLSPTILASGENGAFPHSELTDRRMREGDFVIADLTFRYRGYCSDATRTFGIKSLSKEMKLNYEAVLDAQEYGCKLSREGAVCGDVHEGVVSRLKKYSLERYYIHGTGHGVGIEVHEIPSLRKKSRTRLVNGDVITVEPGIYLPGRYGIRIEDTLLIDGLARPLSHYRKELVLAG